MAMAMGETTRATVGARRPRGLVLLATMGLLAALTVLVPAAVAPVAPAAADPVQTAMSSIASRGNTSCGVTRDGGAYCWGANSAGQLGNGTTDDIGSPVAVSGLGSGVAAVSEGDGHSCAVTVAGAASCWGSNDNGQLGNGSTTSSTVPVAVAGLGSGVDAIAAGGASTCALSSTGAVSCWGQNSAGQLGNGSTTPSTTPLPVTGLGSGVTAIAAGANFACALSTGGAVSCWGGNASGQLGNGTATSSSVPVSVTGLGAGVVAIGAGASHACAVVAGGALHCWGENLNGQLGDGTTTNRSTPMAVSGLGSGVAAVAPGDTHSCAVTLAGAVWCWGANQKGQLGDGTTTDRTVPVAVSGLSTGTTAVSTGSSFSCALTAAGVAQCWGDPSNGRLGRPTSPFAVAPQPVVGAGSALTTVAAGVEHACGMTTGDAVVCWGDNSVGQLGDGGTTRSTAPVTVTGLADDAMSVAVGGAHSCAVVSGAAWCWGYGEDGRLGNGGTADSAVPVPVTGLEAGVASISASWGESCAVSTAGALSCWGVNGNGQLGDGSTSPSSVPVPVTGLGSGVVAVTIGAAHACALTDVGGVWCWGGGFFGQLGNGDTSSSPDPVPVTGLGSGVTAISAGWGHTCAITAVGAAVCWGANFWNQLGDGSDSSSPTPVAVTGLTAGVTGVAAGTAHSCAIAAGVLRCWGANDYGQLGNGSVDPASTPGPGIVLPGGQAAAQVSGGSRFTCARSTVDVVSCWGTNESSQLGSPPSAWVPGPVDGGLTFGPLVANPALEVVKSADQSSVVVGEVIDLHVTVTNTGNVALHDVTVDDPNEADCEVAPFDLAVGAAQTVDCTHLAVAGDVGTYSNVASVTSAEVTTPVASNPVEVAVTAAAPGLSIVKSADETEVSPGEAIHFHLVVTNTGNVALHGVDVADDAAPDCGDDAVFDLAVGADQTIDCTYTTTLADIGTYANSASVTSAETGPQRSNKVSVTVGPAVAVELSAVQPSVPAGDVIDYRVRVENLSALTLSDLAVAGIGAPGCDPVPPLAPAATATVDCAYRTSVGDLGTRTATAAVGSPSLPPVLSNSVSVEVTVPAGSGLVTGTVTESGSGSPVAKATVALLSTADYSPVALATADRSGAFTAVAPAGSYLVYVLDTSGAHASRFHGAPSVVTVTAGGTVTADTALVSVRGDIAGTVSSDGGGPLAGALAISVDLASGGPAAGDLTGVDGSYVIAGVAPGPRLMEFVDLDGAHAPEFFDDAPTPAGASILSVVGAGTVTADAGLAPQTAPTGGAHLVGEITSSAGGRGLAGVAVMAVRTSDFSVGGGGLTDANGAYDIEVDPGGYRLAFYDPSASHGFEWFDDQGPGGIADATVVTATAGAPVTADAVLTPTTGTVSGTVTDAATGDPLATAAVFAIDTNGAVVGATTTQPSGTWKLTGLRPGAVRLRFLDLTGARASEYHVDAPDYAAATLLTITAGGAVTGIDAALDPVL